VIAIHSKSSKSKKMTPKFEARVRVTTLQNYHRWMTGGMTLFNDSAPDDIYAFLENVNQPAKESMDRGTAFHEMIEFAEVGSVIETYRTKDDRFEFDFEKLDTSIPRPSANEVPISKKLLVGDTVLKVTGHIDAMSPSRLRDWKTTAKYDWHTYNESYQWRLYCYLTGIDEFVYDVFTIPTGSAVVKAHDRQVEIFTKYHVPEVKQLLSDWVNFVKMSDSILKEVPGKHRDWIINGIR
jgi:hypothetical protein